MSQPPLRLDFDVLYYQDGDAVIAHCLQTDTAAFGEDVPSARESLRAALELELDSADPQRVYAQRAPDDLWSKPAAESWQYLAEKERPCGLA